MLLCVAGCAIAVAQSSPPSPLTDEDGNLRLFPTRNDLYELKDTNGTAITARIIRIDPPAAELTVFIPATEMTSRFPLSLLDEGSQKMVEDWFFKDEMHRRLRISTEEVQAGRSYQGYSGPLSQPSHSGVSTSVSSTVNERKIVAEIFNGTDLNLKEVDVLVGVRVERRESDSGNRGSGTGSGFYVAATVNVPVLASRQQFVAESPLVPLLNYNESYTITTEQQVHTPGYGWRTRTIVNKYRLRITDRISSHYVVVLYKGEPMARYAPRTDLNSEMLKHFESFRKGEAHLEGSGSGRSPLWANPSY